MRLDHIFSTFILEDSLDVDNQKISEFCYKKELESESRQLSNRGGWQGLVDIDSIELKQLFREIQIRVNRLHSFLGYNTKYSQYIVNAWANINRHKNFNTPHIHAASFVSGVYYVKGTPDAGNIQFMSPLTTQVALEYPVDGIEKYTGFNSTGWCHAPAPGKLLLFPSWLWHYVEENNSNEDRISIAFNTQVKKN